MATSFAWCWRATRGRARAIHAAATPLVLAGLVAVGPLFAQTPQKPPTPQPAPAVPPAAQKPAPVAPTAQPSPPAPPAEAYSYNPEGRRDPFVSLTQRGSDLRGPANRPEGLAGQLIGDIMVKGIVKTPRGFVAMVQAPDSKTFIVHVNERLFDGTIKAITEDAVVFSQEVNDPLSLIKQREVRKPLRAMQEGK